MSDPIDVVPPNDKGSDTFARYKYQAHVAFPYCFELVRSDEISNVFAEHVEDITIETPGSWRFLQVKTRDAGRGPWTLGEVLQSGAIRSLWRAYQAVGPSIDATYELQLEGALGNGDALAGLAHGDLPDEAFRARLAHDLAVDVGDVDLFASRLRVRDLPVRGSIIANNLRLIGKVAPGLAAGDIEQIYDGALVAIESAMTADRLDDRWPAALFMTADERLRLRVESKRIGHEHARQIFARVVGPPPLRSTIVAASSSRTAPFILPQRDVSTFTGRSEELRRLESVLLRQEGERVGSIAGVSGAGGIGKSALACHFAELHRDAFPDGVIGLRVDGKELIGIAREFARCAFVEIDPDDDRDASAIMQEVFRGRSALLLFDNADNATIRALLPGGTHCAVIITTRDRALPVALGIPDDARVDLSPLPPEEAIALLGQLVGTRVSEDAHSAARICELVGHLPLALQIAGATLQIQPWRRLSNYESALREEKERLTVLRLENDSALDVRASFSLSLRLLAPDRIAFFACLSVCAQDGFSIMGAAATNGCDERIAEDHLTHLYRLSLINTSAASSKFVLHPLLRLFARELAEERGIFLDAESRHREFFAALVKRGPANDPKVTELLGDEIDDIVAAAESMQRVGVLDYEFVFSFKPFFQQHGYWEKATSIFTAFLQSAERANNWPAVVQFRLQLAKFSTLRGQLSEAEQLLRSLDPVIARIESAAARDRATAMYLNSLGGVLQRLGRFDEAIDVFRKSAALEEDMENLPGIAQVLNSLGGALQRKGGFGEAAEMFRRSAAIDRKLGNRRGEAMTLNSLGGALQREGDFDGALMVLERSNQLSTELGDQRGRAMILTSLAAVLQRKGNLARAAEALEESATIEGRLGNARGQAMVLNSLGGVLLQKGNFTAAVEVLQRSAAIEDRLGNARGQAMVLNTLGGALQRQGKFDEAVDIFRRTAAIEDRLGNARGQAMVLNSLGTVLQRQGKFDEAVDAFRKSHAISVALRDRRSIAMVLNSLGGVLHRQGNLDEAATALRESYAISRDSGDQHMVAMVLNSLGGVLQRQGKFDEAVEALRQSHAISEALADQRSVAMVLNSLGGVLHRQRKLDEAVDAFRKSYALLVKLGDLRGQAMVLNSLGAVLQRQRNFAQADQAFRDSIAIGEKLRDRRHLAMAHTSFGQALLERDPEMAERELRKGFELDVAMKNRKGISIVAPMLVEALLKLARTADALAICNRALAIAPAVRN